MLGGQIGADGTATGTATAGGSVSIAFHPEGTLAYQVQTVQCIEPGDTIDFSLDTPVAAERETFTVDFPARPPTFQYLVVSACSTNITTTQTAILQPLPGCHGSTIDIHVVAQHAPALEYVEKLAVPYTDGGSTTMPATWQLLPERSVTLVNVPADASSLRVAQEFAQSTAVVGDVFTFRAPPTPTSEIAITWKDGATAS